MRAMHGSDYDAAALLAAYVATHYDVEIDGEVVTIRIGKPPPAALCSALAACAASSAVYLTAFNPRSHKRSTRENAHRQRRLLARLSADGIAVLHGDGHLPGSGWPPERSVLAIGIAREQARALAERFGQNAYVEITPEQPARLVLTRHWTPA